MVQVADCLVKHVVTQTVYVDKALKVIESHSGLLKLGTEADTLVHGAKIAAVANEDSFDERYWHSTDCFARNNSSQ